MVNQQNIILMGRLQGVTVDIEGESSLEDFELIEILDDRNPYLALLGIDLATDMNGRINLKKWKMIFEKKSLWVVVPLDPAEGPHYIEPIWDYESDANMDQIYKIMTWHQDWVNPIADGHIAWDRESYCMSDSDEELEHWQNR